MEKEEVINKMHSVSPDFEKELCDNCRSKILSEMQKIKASGKLIALMQGPKLAKRMFDCICTRCKIKIRNKVQKRGGVFK